MRFDLREEAMSRYLKCIEDFFCDIENINSKMVDDLVEILDKTEYEYLQLNVANILEKYNEVINKTDSTLFLDWVESEHSLISVMKHYQIGEQAENVCKEVQDKLQDIITEHLRMADPSYTSAEHPRVSDEDFEDVKAILRLNKEDVEVCFTEMKSTLENEISENEIYFSVPYLINNVYHTSIEFAEAAEKFIGKIHDNIKESLIRIEVDSSGSIENNKLELDSNSTDEKNPRTCSVRIKKQLLKTYDGDRTNVSKFKDYTKYLYNLLIDGKLGKKDLSLTTLGSLTPIYNDVFKKFGTDLIYTSDSSDIKAFGEYIDKYSLSDFFEKSEDVQVYLNSIKNNKFDGYDVISKTLDNVSSAFLDKKAELWQVYYTGTILLYPIIYGIVPETSMEAFELFCKDANNRFLRAFGIEPPKDEEQPIIDVDGIRKTQSDLDEITKTVETIIEKYGVEKINRTISEMSEKVDELLNLYSHDESHPTMDDGEKEENKSNIYGRYKITEQAKSQMEHLCEHYNSLFAPIDRYFKDIIDKRERKYDKLIELSGCINETSGAIFDWITGWTSNDIYGNVSKCLVGQTTCVNEVNAISKIFNSILPQFKKSKILSNITTIFWTITNKSVNNSDPGLYRYVFDHYNIKHHNVSYRNCDWWRDLHSVTHDMENEIHRRSIENAYMATWHIFYRTNELGRVLGETMNERDEKNLRCGIWLNCIRAGMCDEDSISSNEANELVDKLYELYRLEDGVKPKTDISLF